MSNKTKRRIAFYGGSFDPVHRGHMEIAKRISEEFRLDEFVFVPAHHAPHKRDYRPASPFHRFAMLTLATAEFQGISVSTIELDSPDRPYSIETLTTLKRELPDSEIFFVIGADSWEEISTWKRWQEVLTIVNIIVVTRPGHEIGFAHVTDEIRERLVDLRAGNSRAIDGRSGGIFITDSVNIDVSASRIRGMVHDGQSGWENMVPNQAALYISKYGLYR